MTLIGRGRGLRSGCNGDGHDWVLRRYVAREGEHELRVCDDCGRAEVALPAQRVRAHTPAHTISTAAAA